MSSHIHPKWNTKADLTWKEIFNPPATTPHIGIVALARKLEEMLGKETAFKILDDVVEQLAKEWLTELFGETEVSNFQEALAVFGKLIELPVFHIAHEQEIVEITDSKRVVNIKKCIWANAFREMDAGDIGYRWACKPDHLLAKHIHPNFKLHRTKTLMQGEDCCNFTWYWEET